MSLTETEVTQALEAQKGKEAPLVIAARTIVVTDQASHGNALDFLKRLAELKANRVDHYRVPKQKAHEAHKAITAAEKKDLEVIDRARLVVEPAVLAYTKRQREIEEEARRKAEAEEQARLEEMAFREALEAENQGDHDMAAALVEEQLHAPAPAVVVPTQRATVPGTFETERWTGQVRDLCALLTWLANDPTEAAAAITVSQAWLNKHAAAMKKNLRIPGVVAVSVDGLRVRGR